MARLSFAISISLVLLLAGCGGGNDAPTKNEGKIENVPPTAAAPPAGGAVTPGAPAPANNQAKPPPPIPKINE
jgi:hypothetical protein